MVAWIPYTFVRTVIFFIAGIVVAHFVPDGLSDGIATAVASILLVAYFFLVLRSGISRRKFNPGWIGLPLIFTLGYAHLLWQTESRRGDHLLTCTEPVRYYRAIITRFPEERARSWRVEARVDAIRTSDWQPAHGRVMLYLDRDDFPHPAVYGDVLLVRGHPQRPDPAYNPGEFDYRAYLALRNIYHQHYLRRDAVEKIGHAPDNLFRKFAYAARSRADSVLHCYVKGDRQQAIASALVLGVTDGLDNELLDAYSATGTMHILAVSGLHISILYLLLLRLCSPLNRSRTGRWIVAGVSLGVLWLYAFVTGLSPSVLRAVMMFSFLAVARPWARDTNVYNTLAVSAFCLLITDPFLVFSVGFQLSYAAVLGIVYVSPRLLRLWEPRHILTVEIWKMSAVSIAAQLATFPLGLLYFHQFPNYFLLSNLMVVPLSFVVLVAGLVLLVAGIVPIVATVIGFCLGQVIRLLNAIVFAMDDLPFAVADGIHISIGQGVLLCILIAMVMTLLERKRFRYVLWCFAVVVAFTALEWVHFMTYVDVQKLTVYRIRGHTAIDLIDCGRVTFLADSTLKADTRTMRYHVMPHRIISGVQREDSVGHMHVFEGGRIIMWNGMTLLWLNNEHFVVPPGLHVDYVVVSNNAVRDLRAILVNISCAKVVLDGSNSFFFVSRFLEDAKLHKLDVHSVLHQGAFVTIIENRDT